MSHAWNQIERRTIPSPENARAPEENGKVYRRLALFLEKAGSACPEVREIAIGNAVSNMMVSRGSNFGILAKATGIDISEMRYIFAGIFRGEERETELLKRIARALDTNIEEIEQKASTIKPNWNPAIGILINELETIVNIDPEEFRLPINIGLGVRQARESRKINRDQLSGISHVPKPYIVILEHLLMPSEFLGFGLSELEKGLDNTREGFRIMGKIISDRIGGIRDNESIRAFLNRAKEFLEKECYPDFRTTNKFKRYRKGKRLG